MLTIFLAFGWLLSSIASFFIWEHNCNRDFEAFTRGAAVFFGLVALTGPFSLGMASMISLLITLRSANNINGFFAKPFRNPKAR